MSFYHSLISRSLCNKSIAYPNLTLVRHLRLTASPQSLSDPFRPKKLDHDDNPASQNKNFPRLPSDSTLVKLIKKLFAPKPLNVQFKEKFDLNEDFKLVYLQTNERLILINFVLLNMLYPLFMAFLVVFAYAEMTGKSQFEKSFEKPHETAAIVGVWFTMMFAFARTTQATTIFRIYFNDKTNKFVLVRLRGLLTFAKEEFTSADVRCKLDNNRPGTPWTTLKRNFSKNLSNATIGGKRKIVDFKLFTSDKVLEKFLGAEAYKRYNANQTE